MVHLQKRLVVHGKDVVPYCLDERWIVDAELNGIHGIWLGDDVGREPERVETSLTVVDRT